jgi:dsDNA-binding SOS-regulon protein
MKAMSDLVGRLLEHVVSRGGQARDENGEIVGPNGAWQMMLDAAAELTRLREQCEASVGLRQRLALAEEIAAFLSAENERLRKALESAESYLAFLDSCDEGSDEGPIVLAKVREALDAHVGEEKPRSLDDFTDLGHV